ncbi:MAG: FGGY family carbohydrate kinase [Candidatus Limnocylindrus sp.]
MTPQRGALLSIDLGSTAVKVLILDVERGRPLALTRRASGAALSASSGAVEQDPNAWWEAIRSAVREALQLAGSGVEILGIAADGHGPTLVPVREDGSAASPALLWRDRRAVDDDAQLAALLRRTGWLLAELPKARWFLRERAAAARETAWLLSSWDALAFRLSGEAVASFWDPARSLQPAQRALLLSDIGGLDERALPPEVFPGTRIGSLRTTAASDLGLPGGIPIVSGTNDGMAAVIGAGLMHVGRGVDVGGAAGGVGVSVKRAIADRISTEVGGALWSGPAPTSFGEIRIVGGALGGTGLLLDATIAEAIARGSRPDELIDAVARLPLGAEGVRVERRGEAVEISERSREADDAVDERRRDVRRVRAVMEYGALTVAALLAPARAAGLPLHEMWLSGPATGATSGLYAAQRSVPRGIPQMRADVLGVPVVLPRIPEAAAAGSAALAGIGVGHYASLGEAADLIAVAEERIEPEAAIAAAAARLLEQFSRA